MSKAGTFLERVDGTPQDPIRKWLIWTFKDMDLPVDSIKFGEDRVQILTKKFNVKKFRKTLLDYVGEEADAEISTTKVFRLMAYEELKSTRPKNIQPDLDSMIATTELVGDDLIQGVVSFNLEY
jgi:hypothetical protein